MNWLAAVNVKPQRKVYLVPVGKVDKPVLDILTRELPQRFHLPVAVAPQIPVPKKAYDKKRSQYLSTTILKELKKRLPRDAEKALGIVDKDLFVPRLNFVFGEAELGGRAAVIALPRLRQEYYGLKANQKLFLARTLKEAVHELGHTFGLKHCADPKCVMHFSNSLRDTDIKLPDFCSRCQSLGRLPKGSSTRATDDEPLQQ